MNPSARANESPDSYGGPSAGPAGDPPGNGATGTDAGY
jgi:hypothetical protein